ncbi:MAG TPA: DUF2252 family protein [Candidatus Methylomirabilis sp.]|nr:DUF2252 family protein [Candidatus Methylomirabilis sp.]
MKAIADVVQSTAAFEQWAGHHVHLIRSDVQLKHRLMAESPFPFFRATFYRWAQWWPIICPELARAPQVLGVGDLHVENFGTWRDLEGRLIWGVNDFDEAWPAAYTVDLVRLLASAYLAIGEEHLAIPRKVACQAIEQGYRDSIAKGGGPFVLAEHHKWLRRLALSKLRDPVIFWGKIEACPKYKGKLPKDVWKLVHASLPLRTMNYDVKSRIAGLGSLGHPRVLALATWDGAHVVREAKQLTPSAWIWARRLASKQILSRKLIERAVRIRDPHVHFAEHWIVRRLAPDCSHIEIQSLPQERDEERLAYYMGWETANIHLGSRRALSAVKRDLARRKGRWLHKAARSMQKVTLDDWDAWRDYASGGALRK